MILSSTVSDSLSLVDAGVIALLGYIVVFFGLILLMIVMIVMSKLFIAKASKPAVKTEVSKATVAAPAAAPAAAPVAAPAADAAAPGSAGKLKLHDVEPKTAAMLMAIVANKMGRPLNELRFISIKEVK